MEDSFSHKTPSNQYVEDFTKYVANLKDISAMDLTSALTDAIAKRPSEARIAVEDSLSDRSSFLFTTTDLDGHLKIRGATGSIKVELVAKSHAEFQDVRAEWIGLIRQATRTLRNMLSLEWQAQIGCPDVRLQLDEQESLPYGVQLIDAKVQTTLFTMHSTIPNRVEAQQVWSQIVKGSTKGRTTTECIQKAGVELQTVCATLSLMSYHPWQPLTRILPPESPLANSPAHSIDDLMATGVLQVTQGGDICQMNSDDLPHPNWLTTIHLRPVNRWILTAWHAMRLETTHPTAALLLRVAIVERAGSIGNQQGNQESFNRGLRKVCLPQIAENLKNAYDLRSSFAHEGEYMSIDRFIGSDYLFGREGGRIRRCTTLLDRIA